MLRFDIAIGEFLKERLEGFSPEMVTYEYGRVKSVQDGIVQVEGLPHAKYGELLEFEGQVYGMALDMSLTGVGAALLGKADTVVPGSVVRGHGTHFRRVRGARAPGPGGGSHRPPVGRHAA